MPRLVILDPLSADRLDRLKTFMPEGWHLTCGESRDPQAQRAALQDVDYAIAGDVPVTSELFHAPGLKAVHKWGVGYDNFDLDAAREAGVRVMRTTGSNAIAVAETALSMMLALQRNLVLGHMAVSEGEWPKNTLAATSRRLTGRTVGIVGLGYIGKALVKLLHGFDCKILYSKRSRLSAAQEQSLGVEFAQLEDLLARADVVSLHCELNDSTRDMINAQALAHMRPDAHLVNLARGGVVVEEDLAQALKAGVIAGAAVDVFSVEPMTADNPLRQAPNVILTPHLAAMAHDMLAPTFDRMLTNFSLIEAGQEPPEQDTLV